MLYLEYFPCFTSLLDSSLSNREQFYCSLQTPSDKNRHINLQNTGAAHPPLPRVDFVFMFVCVIVSVGEHFSLTMWRSWKSG